MLHAVSSPWLESTRQNKVIRAKKCTSGRIFVLLSPLLGMYIPSVTILCPTTQKLENKLRVGALLLSYIPSSCSVKTGPDYLAQAGLEIAILLPSLPLLGL